MGVNELLAYLRKRDPKIVQSCDLSEFKGHRIAVDVAILGYRMKSQYITKMIHKIDVIYDDINYEACTNYMFRGVLKVVDGILVAGCVPIMVFDGPAPALKNRTKQDRTNKSDRKKFIIAELKRIGKGLLDGKDFALTQNDMEFLNSFKPAITTIQGIKDHLFKQMKQLVQVNGEDYIQLSFILTSLGVPNFRAQCEAEKTCSMMAMRRDVIAVLTTDSDCLMYGCPIMISKLTLPTTLVITSKPKVECYSFANALVVMDLTHSEFVDFCIMCGTDFNKYPRGYGVESNYTLIKTFGSITKMRIIKKQLEIKLESMMTKEEKLLLRYDIDILNYDEVRSYISSPPVYNRASLEIRCSEDQYENAVATLTNSIGEKKFKQIADVSKSVVAHLSSVSKFCRRLRQ